MQFEDFGTLTVFTTSAGTSLPIERSIVHVRGAAEENRFIEYSVVTDVDGVTPKLLLPCPAVAYSLSPSSPEVPYGLYDVEVLAKGYYTKIIRNVAIFSGINTNLPVNMIPSPIHQNNIDYPRGNLDTIISENEKL